MKAGTVQINWHGTKPVLTLDFHPLSGLLATGGADFDIKVWLINSGGAQKNIPSATFQNSLSYHCSAVNTLRFAPSGELLASGADGGEMIIWKLHTTETSQTWKVLKTLLFHRKDVLDLQWSPNSAFLISGSVDNSCIIWDVNKGSVHQILDGHFHYVQGVAWDPLAEYVASLSSDRTCRVYALKSQAKGKGVDKIKNYVCQHVISKTEQPLDDSKSSKTHLFHDETLPSFFRRLAWSPDGSFVVVPAGSFKTSPASDTLNATYVFSRKDLSRPALLLPGANKPVVAVRFCPITFSLRGSHSATFFKLPYRLIFAVATLNSLYIYDTESAPPIAILAGLHYAAITDIAWSSNAQFLAVSSQDGFCTLVEFEMNELGLPISVSEHKKNVGEESKDPIVEKPVDMTEARKDDDSIESEHVELKVENSTFKKPDDMMIEAHTDDGCTAPASMETKVENPTSQKPDDMMIETQTNDGSTAPSTIETKVEENQVKQVLPSSINKQVPTKPAKRRITPMAIDP